jgi:hypothetical protein
MGSHFMPGSTTYEINSPTQRTREQRCGRFVNLDGMLCGNADVPNDEDY